MTMHSSNSAEATAAAEVKERVTMMVVGLGGAGGNAVHAMTREGLEGVRFIAMNTDARALEACEVPEKVILGARLTRGLGAGGDPELGRTAAEQETARLREVCAGTDLVFIVAGLGGGTGTGGGPVLAQIAREEGALVAGLVTLPFEFEGMRRQGQADAGLAQLKAAADVVICLPNQRLFGLVDEKTSLVEAFNLANDLLAQGVRGIWRLLGRTGLINVDFADLCHVMRGRHAEGVVVTAGAAGEGRAQEIVGRLTTHALLEDGQMLAEADAALITLAGGPDLTMAEVNRVMELVHRQCENAHLIIGASVDADLGDRLLVTLIAARRSPSAAGAHALNANEPPDPSPSRPRTVQPVAHRPDEQLLPGPDQPRPPSRFVAPPPELSADQKEALMKRQSQSGGRRRRSPQVAQTQLSLEIVSRGRFEKSEPTIHHGEDLDVPTYIRRGVALN